METIERRIQGASRYGLALQLLAIIVLSATLFPALTPRQVVGSGTLTKLLFMGRMGVLLTIATIFLRLRGLEWTDLGLRRPRLSRMIFSVVGGLFVSAALVAIVQQVVRRLGAPAADYSMFEPLKGNLTEYLYWALPVTLGSAALGEELVFRGFVRDALQRLLGSQDASTTSVAVALQAALFGLVHLYQGWSGVATAGTIGLVLGSVWLASGRNLWAGIVTHALLDLTSMTVIFFEGVPMAR